MKKDQLSNAKPLQAIFPKGTAPIVALADDGQHTLWNTHWGFVLPQVSKKTYALGTVVLERTVLELQGEPRLSCDEVDKGMAVTRTSGTPMKDFDTLFQAITAYATRAAENLRRHGLVAGTLTVFYHTNRHRHDRPKYSGSRSSRLMPTSSDTFALVEAARRTGRMPKGSSPDFRFYKSWSAAGRPGSLRQATNLV